MYFNPLLVLKFASNILLRLKHFFALHRVSSIISIFLKQLQIILLLLPHLGQLIIKHCLLVESREVNEAVKYVGSLCDPGLPVGF